MKTLLGLVLIYLTTASAFAKEYHVAPGGNNDNDGSALKPFRTISAAAQQARAGDYSQGLAFVHNLVTGKTVHKDVMNRYTPYHYPHSTELAGTSTITGRDDRFYNNIFAIQQGGNSQTDNAEAFGAVNDRGESYGLNAYNVYSPSMQAYLDTLKKAGNVYVVTFAKVEQPVYIGSNLYFGVGKPCIHEKNSIKDENF
ncbi:MAG: hypothetical protein WCP85_29945 [Mariniphaga sp.]